MRFAVPEAQRITSFIDANWASDKIDVRTLLRGLPAGHWRLGDSGYDDDQFKALFSGLRERHRHHLKETDAAISPSPSYTAKPDRDHVRPSEVLKCVTTRCDRCQKVFTHEIAEEMAVIFAR